MTVPPVGAIKPWLNARERHFAEQLELGLFHIPSGGSYYSAIPADVQHFTWLGSARAASVGPEPAAPSGRNRQAERRESQGAAACGDYASSPGAKKPAPNARERHNAEQLLLGIFHIPSSSFYFRLSQPMMRESVYKLAGRLWNMICCDSGMDQPEAACQDKCDVLQSIRNAGETSAVSWMPKIYWLSSVSVQNIFRSLSHSESSM